MKPFLKQSTASATAFLRSIKDNMFVRARMKLTFFYVIGIALVLFISSIALIKSAETNIRNTYSDNLEAGEVFDRAIFETNEKLENTIYLIDIVLLLVLGAGSYILAGHTLRPIKIALDVQKRFSADASHDLRTPLSIIMTESEVALANENSTISDHAEALSNVLVEAQSMSRLIEDLLLLARSDSVYPHSTMRETHAQEIIDPVIASAKKQADQKNITLSISEIPDSVILVDEHHVRRAIQNIVQNAIRYTPKFGSVSIDVREGADNLSITIKDTGIGIAKHDIPHVFERFYKAEHSRTDVSGSGLGLAIAKEIVSHHHGEIAIESELGKGTTVTIKLPLV